MAYYLDIGGEAQVKLFRDIKQKSGLTWRKIWEGIGVGRSMIYFYRSGKCHISKEKLEKLLKLTNYPLDSIELKFVGIKHTIQEPIIQEMNEKIAEFLGILYGDGCLGNHGYAVVVSGDSNADLLYHKTHVAPLIKELFGIDSRFKFEKNKNEMHTIVSSKVLHEYIAKKFYFPIGEKKGRMHIPTQIYENNQYKRAFLRGLFDTDGGIHRHHVKSAQVHFTSADPVFLKEVFDLYKDLGFNVRTTDEDLEFFSREEIAKFFSELKPKNPKHLYKYQQFLEKGIVPRHRDIDYGWLNTNYARAGNRTRATTLARSSHASRPLSRLSEFA